MGDLCLVLVAENHIFTEIASLERQESSVMSHAYELCPSKFFPWVLQECEFVEAGVVKVIAKIDMSERTWSTRVVLDTVVKGVDYEIADIRSRALRLFCESF